MAVLFRFAFWSCSLVGVPAQWIWKQPGNLGCFPESVRWAWLWTELHLLLVPALTNCNWDAANYSFYVQLSPEKRRKDGEKRMQKWAGGVHGVRSFSVYQQVEDPIALVCCLKPGGSRCHKSVLCWENREWWFLSALWFRGVFSAASTAAVLLVMIRKLHWEFQEFGQAAKLFLQKQWENGNSDSALYISAKSEWNFMRQRKGTSPGGLCIKGLLHTVDVWELFKGEVTNFSKIESIKQSR